MPRASSTWATFPVAGPMHILDEPRVFAAINPYYGVHFLYTHGGLGLVPPGAVFFAVPRRGGGAVKGARS